MTSSFDVAIVGLGAMGSAAAYELSQRGQRVVGFDMYTPPHAFGSTHGESRIIREAYYEHPFYVPIVQRSYEKWRDLEAAAGETVLYATGGVMIGPEDGGLVAGTRLSADRWDLDYEMLSRRELKKRFPMFRPAENMVGLYEPHAGVLFPEKAVEADLALAKEKGAEFHFEEKVTEWRATADGVELKSDAGTYQAQQLVLTPGAWMKSLVPELALPLTIERQVLYWFEPAIEPASFLLGNMPLFAIEYTQDAFFYGIPDVGNGVKVALHHQGIVADSLPIDRTVDPNEIEGMRLLLQAYAPAVDGKVLDSAVCMYTNTPDEHFLIDRHPDQEQVLIVSPCSGHGFKFAAVIGEIVADLVTQKQPQFDLTPFQMERLRKESE